MTLRKKLIEVALPLDAINEASAREKSIRHGHPSTLHLWWARRPLAACRAVLFGQLVDDPSSWPDLFPTDAAQETERLRLFALIRDLVQWENSNNEPIVMAARVEIARSLARGRKADGRADERDEAVLRVPPPYTGIKYASLAADEEKAVNSYLAEVAPPVHDPFAGGGSIPLEAQRLGLRAIATDLNPVAVLINKALIEIPPKFAGMPPVNPDSRRKAAMGSWKGAQGLAEDVRYYGKWMRDEAFKRIGHLYPPVEITKEMAEGRDDLKGLVGQKLTAIAWIWARTVASPNPACRGAHVPLVSSFWLSRKPERMTWLEPVIGKGRSSWSFTVKTGKPADASALANGTRAGKAKDFVCLLSGTPLPREYVRQEAKAGRMRERVLAVVVEGKGRRAYLAATEEEENLALQAEELKDVGEARSDFLAGLLPTRAMITGGVCSAYGLDTWGKLFSGRQVKALLTLADLVTDALAEIESDTRAVGTPSEGGREYGKGVAAYLALAIGRTADRSSTLCSWDSSPKMEALRNTFARQALPMVWDHAECNIFSSATGNLMNNVEWISKVVEACVGQPAAPCVAEQRDATKLANARTAEIAFSTDPPYYDNISYAELSDYFYVWSRRALRTSYPALFSTLMVPKTAELIASPARFGGDSAAAKAHFEDGLGDVLIAMHAACPDNTPISVYYAFKQTETDDADDTNGVEGVATSTGWETMLSSIINTAWMVTGTLPLRTEMANRTVGIGANALASSIVVICRKRPDSATAITRAGFRRLLREELPAALRHLQRGNIAPVDVAQASIGPGMAVFSRHSKVLEADGTPMSVRTALQLINQALDEYLTEQEGEFDPDTRFAVTWFETRAFETGPFGEAETLAKARNIAVSGVAEAGILSSAAGKVRLLKRAELPDDWDPRTDRRLTVWESVQHLIKRLETKGETAAAELLAVLGANAAPARDLAYRLYSTCERKGWADEARAYNGLVVAWPELEKLAAQAGEAKPKQGMLL